MVYKLHRNCPPPKTSPSAFPSSGTVFPPNKTYSGFRRHIMIELVFQSVSNLGGKGVLCFLQNVLFVSSKPEAFNHPAY